MYLSSNKDQNQRKFLGLARTIVLIGGLLAAVLEFYKPKSGLVISVFMGISLSYLVTLIPARRSQLIAMLGLAVGAGLIPTIILWTLCYIFHSTTSCQITLLRAQTFGFFAFPTIFMIFSWVTTLFYKPTR